VLLFNNLPGLIEYLVRDTKRKVTLENEACPKDDSFDRRFQDLQDQNTVESTANAESGDVSDCQSDYSEQSGYSSSNDNLKQLGHEYNFQDPLERVPPKNGYQGLTEILLKQIYEQFFQSERHEEAFKQSVLDKVIQQLIQIMDCMTTSDKRRYIIPIIIDCIKDEEDDERRLVGVVLIDELAQSLGSDLCRDHIMYDFISLQDDPIFKIRREVALRLMRLSRVLGE
jgi:hypothetical protein